MALYCKYCGMKNEDVNSFCKGCGKPLTRLDAEKEGSGSAPNAEIGYQRPIRKTALVSSIFLNKKILIGLGAAVAAIIVILVLALNAGKTIHLADYVEIDSHGTNGYGTASIDIDYEKMQTDAFKAMGYDMNEMAAYGLSMGSSFGSSSGDYYMFLQKYPHLMEDMQTIEGLRNNIKTDLDRAGMLSNGDKVTASINYAGLPNDRIKIEAGKKTIEISGLKEIEDVDPFEGVTVTFVGFEKHGKANLKNNNELLKRWVSFSADKEDGLSEGDKVVVTAEYDAAEVERAGYHLTQDKKEFTVGKLGKVSTIDVFSEFVPKYSGIAPFAALMNENPTEAVLHYDVYGEPTDIKVKYSIEAPEQLEIGSVITVKATYNKEQLAGCGKKAESDTKVITVSENDVDCYIQDPADIDEELMEEMKKTCKDKLLSYLEDGTDFYHSNEQYVGAFTLTAKEEQLFDSNNTYLIFKAAVKSDLETSERKNAEVYFVYKSEAVMKQDGQQIFANGSFTTDFGDLERGNIDDINLRWSTVLDAFNSLDDIREEFIDSRKDSWNAVVRIEGQTDSAANETQEVTGEKPAEAEEAVEENNSAAEAAEAAAPATEAPAEEAPAEEGPVEEGPVEETISLPYGGEAPASDFLFPYSSEELIDENLIDSAKTAKTAINEIYARYGYTFHPESSGTATSQEAYDKFNALSWYKEAQKSCIIGDASDDNDTLLDSMNSIEQENIRTLRKYE